MFKFDFFGTENSSPDLGPTEAPSAILSESTGATTAESAHTARRVEPSCEAVSQLKAGVEGQVAWQSADVTLVKAVPRPGACPSSEESDLVPGVYEGGLKVWEGCIDLVEYLASLGVGVGMPAGNTGELPNPFSGDGRQAQVLELGCGHGFPGIMALRQGMRVCFSDFNREVIEQVTIPNVHLNSAEKNWRDAEYYCGDWGSLSPLLSQRSSGGRFDLILTAETLYTTAVSEKVLDMILRHLAVGGQGLVASKRFYFGTGGSTLHFSELVEADGRLVCTDAAVVDTGKGNIREILRVRWKEAGVERSGTAL